MKEHNGLMRVHPKFRRVTKVCASMNDMTITEFTEKLADDLEYNYKSKGFNFEEARDEKKKYPRFKFTF